MDHLLIGDVHLFILAAKDLQLLINDNEAGGPAWEIQTKPSIFAVRDKMEDLQSKKRNFTSHRFGT